MSDLADRHDRDGVPFDESFVHGARYHEPSAQDRARWVKDARRTKRRNAKARREPQLAGLGARLLPWGSSLP
ncbi:MAG: hypothetical protein M5T61_14715 [Acidimicrobiia bacterium]|nr:hypothetical protein [Acidimicrobiia bacterium]